jgi:hypothetical protein
LGRSAANDRARDTRDSFVLWIAQRRRSATDYRRGLNERENDLLALSEESGPRSVAHATALRQTHDARMQYNQIQTSVRRPLNKTTIRAAFFVALGLALALALLEAPVNKYLFDVAPRSAASFSKRRLFASSQNWQCVNAGTGGSRRSSLS